MLGFVPCGENEEGYRDACCPCFFADLIPGLSGEHEVKNHEVVVPTMDEDSGEGLLAVPEGVDRVALSGEAFGYDPGKLWFVFDYEYAHVVRVMRVMPPICSAVYGAGRGVKAS